MSTVILTKDRAWGEVDLTRGYRAKFDVADLDVVVGKCWQYLHGYAVHSVVTPPQIRMHREILGLPPGRVPQVDHRNHDTLDNRRQNLRIVTNGQNQANRVKQVRLASSRYKGVSWSARLKKWKAEIKVDSKRIHLGYFTSERAAARAYNRAAIAAFGEFAHLNDTLILWRGI
jgi:hypothetical protein